MAGLIQVFILAFFIIVGILLVRLKLAPSKQLVDIGVTLMLIGLLASMGLLIGSDPELTGKLKSIGLLALASALASSSGTLIAIFLFFNFRKSQNKIVANKNIPFTFNWKNLKQPLFLLAVVIAGIIAGLIFTPNIQIGNITNWILDFLLLFIGMQFAYAKIKLKTALLHIDSLLVPLLTIIGTLLFSLILVPFFNLTIGKALALGAGFGWYSISGVLITNMGDSTLGSVAFLANMLRETIALIAIPFLSRTAIPYLAIGIGGATSMDVTLPLIKDGAGPEIVPISFISGAILSFLVPLLVPIFFQLG